MDEATLLLFFQVHERMKIYFGIKVSMTEAVISHEYERTMSGREKNVSSIMNYMMK